MNFTPITGSVEEGGLEALDQEERDRITDLLLGHKVTKVSDDHLLLDNGTTVMVIANEGCGGCSDGWYHLTELNDVDNIITRVEFDYHPDDSTGHYRIFVYTANDKINLLRVDGSDGNGWYGTGFELIVRKTSS